MTLQNVKIPALKKKNRLPIWIPTRRLFIGGAIGTHSRDQVSPEITSERRRKVLKIEADQSNFNLIKKIENLTFATSAMTLMTGARKCREVDRICIFSSEAALCLCFEEPRFFSAPRPLAAAFSSASFWIGPQKST